LSLAMTFGDGAGSEPVVFAPRGGLVRPIFHVEIETRDREGFATWGTGQAIFHVETETRESRGREREDVEIETRDREGFAHVGDWSGDFPRGN
jgi:hypothetical protein